MAFNLKYVQQRVGGFRYRRRVPKRLHEALGKTEIVIPLGNSESEARRNYSKANAQAEQQLELGADPKVNLTEYQRYTQLLAKLRGDGVFSRADVEHVDSEGYGFSPLEGDADKLVAELEAVAIGRVPRGTLVCLKRSWNAFVRFMVITLLCRRYYT